MGGFEAPKTIADVIQSIAETQYVLPAIQREFIWREEKICSLFDSLMRKYPIGGFLFWKITDETFRSHTFYGFIRDYDPRGAAKYSPPLGDLPPSDDRYAILDGQQRLTSLNIGLRGSHTVKRPRLWWDNPEAFEQRWLYLDLNGDSTTEATGSEEESGDTEEYVFRFKTPVQADDENAAQGRMWVRVADILTLRNTGEVMQYAAAKGFGADAQAATIFGRLHEVVTVEKAISPYLEVDQSIDRVMNIFIRVNAQGEPLSFADLLLSQATAAWVKGEEDEQVDAREEIRSCVDELNRPEHRFDFRRDQVMKACLVLTDANSVRFQIANFDTSRMLAIRSAWPEIRTYLNLGVKLLEEYGFSAGNLTARSVIHPIAYYLKRRGADNSYITSKVYADDRSEIHRWLVRTLLRQGTWGSGLDTLLTRLRDAIRDHGATGFPAAKIERSMAEAGKSLAFNEEDILGLASTRYADKGCFALLSLLYPQNDVIQRHHVDHIYPRALFHKRSLAAVGFSDEEIDQMKLQAEEIGNLQLLTATENVSKGATPPKTWLESHFPDAADRAAIAALHSISDVTDDVKDFPAFYTRRRLELERKLREVLGVPQPEADDPLEAAQAPG